MLGGSLRVAVVLLVAAVFLFIFFFVRLLSKAGLG
jgi:hypothetical protein